MKNRVFLGFEKQATTTKSSGEFGSQSVRKAGDRERTKRKGSHNKGQVCCASKEHEFYCVGSGDLQRILG